MMTSRSDRYSIVANGVHVFDAQVSRAVAVWDMTRCSINEQANGGFCAPAPSEFLKSLEPVMRPVLEDFYATITSASARGLAAGPYRAFYDGRRAYTETNYPKWTKDHGHKDAITAMAKAIATDLLAIWDGVDACV